MHGIAHEDTWNRQVLASGNQGVTIEQLIAMVPDVFRSTLRYKACVTGATISAVVGSATRSLDVDDHLDLITAIRTQLGAAARGRVRATLAPQQLDELARAYRTEPAFQASVEAFGALAQVAPGQVYENFAGAGVDIMISDDVVQSGGAYQGFAVTPGGIGWVRASTNKIVPTGMGRAYYVPEYGLFIIEIDRSDNQKSRYHAIAWVGTALGSSSVYFQTRVRSKV
jgi:hypothetical protein